MKEQLQNWGFAFGAALFPMIAAIAVYFCLPPNDTNYIRWIGVASAVYVLFFLITFRVDRIRIGDRDDLRAIFLAMVVSMTALLCGYAFSYHGFFGPQPSLIYTSWALYLGAAGLIPYILRTTRPPIWSWLTAVAVAVPWIAITLIYPVAYARWPVFHGGWYPVFATWACMGVVLIFAYPLRGPRGGLWWWPAALGFVAAVVGSVQWTLHFFPCAFLFAVVALWSIPFFFINYAIIFGLLTRLITTPRSIIGYVACVTAALAIVSFGAYELYYPIPNGHIDCRQ